MPLRPLPAAALPAAVLAAVLAAAVAGCGTTTTYRSSGSPTRTARPLASGSQSPSGSSSARAFGAFAGRWSGHGGYLMVQPDGRFTISRRTYRWCSQGPPPCDTISGNVITNGDVAGGQLASVSGHAATGRVTKTTDPADSPMGRITITLDPATDTITAADARYCGPSAPAGNCGA